MDFIFIKLEIYVEKVVKWHATIITKDLRKITGVLQIGRENVTQVIWEM